MIFFFLMYIVHYRVAIWVELFLLSDSVAIS